MCVAECRFKLNEPKSMTTRCETIKKTVERKRRVTAHTRWNPFIIFIGVRGPSSSLRRLEKTNEFLILNLHHQPCPFVRWKRSATKRSSSSSSLLSSSFGTLSRFISVKWLPRAPLLSFFALKNFHRLLISRQTVKLFSKRVWNKKNKKQRDAHGSGANGYYRHARSVNTRRDNVGPFIFFLRIL
jgi:hypothetical protein